MTEPKLHPSAACESTQLGEGTRVGALARVRAGAVLGRNCTVGDQAFIDDDVVIGDRVIVEAGAYIGGGVRLEDDVVVGARATLTRGASAAESGGATRPTVVQARATLGANATLEHGVSVGTSAFVQPGTVVLRDVPPNAIVAGNPARISGYVGSSLGAGAAAAPQHRLGAKPTNVPRVTVHELKLVHDLRGNLSVGEFEKDVPFVPRRYFMVFDVPTSEVRGEHAHRKCHQFLVCARGACSVVVDDGRVREEHRLDRPNLGVYLPPMVWGVQYKFTADGVLLVFASDLYDPADYIREHAEFMRLVGR